MSFIKKAFFGVALLALAACDVPTETSAPAPVATAQAPTPSQLSGRQAARQFVGVVETVEPVAERE